MDFVSWFLQNFEKLPAPIKDIVSVLLVAVLLFFAIKYLLDIISGGRKLFARPRTHNKLSLEDLFHHELFSKSENWHEMMINSIFFGDEDRNFIFRTIIKSRISAITNKLRIFLSNNNDINTFDSHNFANRMFNILAEIINVSDQEVQNAIMEMHPDTGHSIYCLVMEDKDKGFKQWHNSTISYLEQMINDISHSNIYYDNYSKLYVILDLYKSSIDVTIPHMEKAFNCFNGELTILLTDIKK
jgi:hypothetical protein